MNFRSFGIPLFTTVLAFCTLYAPQPILPLLAQEFSVSASEVSLLVSLTLFPLGVAPVVYGYLIDNLSARSSLLRSVGLLAITELGFAFVADFRILLGLRLAQGLLLPAIFTALVTYIGDQASPEERQKAVSSYIAATITGGFAGRFVTGFIADVTGWRMAFTAWGLGLSVAWGLLWRLENDPPSELSRLPVRGIWEMFKRPRHRRVYLTIFLVFFGFASILNALPFRVKELMPTASESLIATAYLGYLMGVLVSLNAQRICARLGSEINGALLGITVFGVGILMLGSTNLVFIFSAVFVFCSGFFLMHSTLSGYINHHTHSQRGVANGLYIAFYYGGGSLGSYFPLIVYHGWGWYPYLAVVLGCVGGGFGMAGGLRNFRQRT